MENYKPANSCGSNGWRILGPGGGGAQYIPTVSPFDQDTALVACDMTGSYITHDGGKSWRELNFKVWVGAFAFDPLNEGVIYAGATGLYRSVDNGETWSLVFPGPAHVTGEAEEGDHAKTMASAVILMHGSWLCFRTALFIFLWPGALKTVIRCPVGSTGHMTGQKTG